MQEGIPIAGDAEAVGSLPISVRGWLLAIADGADARALLNRCLLRAREASPDAAWICLASDEDLERQLQALDGMLRSVESECTAIDVLARRKALLQRYPLFGVPFAIKDNIDVEGVPTTAACPAYSYLATTTAASVRRLQQAGAIWIGKTNLDQFATGLVGTRSPYGRPASVFSDRHVSGGSSSGSAVLVATGIVAFSLGTDTAGSGRVPAAFNQIVGLKPTPGRVGTSGVVPACRSLDCVSIFALTVDDAAHVLSVMEGPDADDCYSRFTPGPAGWSRDALRIGYPRELRLAADDAYGRLWEQALELAAALGHSLVPVDFAPMHRTAELLYPGPWIAERYGVVRDLIEKHPEAMDPAVSAVIGAATKFGAADLFGAQHELKFLQQTAARVWESADVLLVPTASAHPRFDDVAADPVGANGALGVYTNFVNLLGWCALALPAARTADGLPFGVTFIAPANHEAALAALGRDWQQRVDLELGVTGARCGASPAGAALPTPMRWPAVQKTLALAVVGAHLSGMPLNGQLTERGARLRETTTTAGRYRLFALPATTPPKPGLVRSVENGHAIALEVWDMPIEQVGSFLALIPPPLGLGSLELADGRWVHGFICETHAVAGARDVSAFGGWRDYVRSLSAPASSK